MKMLDFVRPIEKPNKIGIILKHHTYTSVSGEIIDQGSIYWLEGSDGLKTAWWYKEDLIIIDNLSNIINKG